MYRFNYKINDVFESKFFDTIEEAYWFAVNNIATEEDCKWYKDICGETFNSIVERETGNKSDLMRAIMRNSMENVVMFEEV
jgi:hypothetical protein